MVGLQAGKVKRRVFADFKCQCQCRGTWFDTAAVMSNVDFHEHVNIGGDARGRAPIVHDGGKPVDAFDAVHADGDFAAVRQHRARQRHNARQLERRNHFIADKHVVNATGHQGLGFGRLLYTNADSTSGDLHFGQRGTLVHFRVWPEPDLVPPCKGGHLGEISLHRIEIDDQRRRID